jgi:hypothetical protein
MPWGRELVVEPFAEEFATDVQQALFSAFTSEQHLLVFALSARSRDLTLFQPRAAGFSAGFSAQAGGSTL